MSKLVKQICRNLLRLRRSSGHKKNSVWGGNSYNVKYLVTQLSVFKAHTLYDIIFHISKRHLVKQQYYARKKLGGRKKKIIIIIRTKSIGLSTEKWKDLIMGENPLKKGWVGASEAFYDT